MSWGRAVDEPVVVLDERHAVTIANQAFYRWLNLTAEQVAHVDIFQLKESVFDSAALRQTIERDLAPTSPQANLQIDLNMDAHVQRFAVDARRLYTQGEEEPMTVLVIRAV